MHPGLMGFGGYGFYGGAGSLFILIVLWSLLWKGLALWHSAQRKEVWWFIAMLILNTAGILEIVYLFAVAKEKPSELFAFIGMTDKKTSSESAPSSERSHPID